MDNADTNIRWFIHDGSSFGVATKEGLLKLFGVVGILAFPIYIYKRGWSLVIGEYLFHVYFDYLKFIHYLLLIFVFYEVFCGVHAILTWVMYSWYDHRRACKLANLQPCQNGAQQVVATIKEQNDLPIQNYNGWVDQNVHVDCKL